MDPVARVWELQCAQSLNRKKYWFRVFKVRGMCGNLGVPQIWNRKDDGTDCVIHGWTFSCSPDNDGHNLLWNRV